MSILWTSEPPPLVCEHGTLLTSPCTACIREAATIDGRAPHAPAPCDASRGDGSYGLPARPSSNLAREAALVVAHVLLGLLVLGYAAWVWWLA